ncbi:MAG: hypothetical protein AAGA77_18700 [Bacteroidota bacterium]
MSNKTITGKVTYDDGEALPGTLIYIRGHSLETGTTSSLEGEYSIEAKPEDTLIYMAEGYMQNEKLVGSNTVINVEMYEPPDFE